MAENKYLTHIAEYEWLSVRGFDEETAARLIHMKEHIAEQIERQEMLAEVNRLEFIRWLFQHDRIPE